MSGRCDTGTNSNCLIITRLTVTSNQRNCCVMLGTTCWSGKRTCNDGQLYHCHITNPWRYVTPIGRTCLKCHIARWDNMKLKSKYKWSLVGLVFVISWVGMFTFPMLGFMVGFPLVIVSFILLMASACYGVIGMIDAKLFERFMCWLKTDDV